MKRIYDENDQYIIVKENGKFGIEDKSGHLLLPLEYDRIIVACEIKDGIGFILCKNGKFGYIEFGKREHLEEYENGVVLGDPNGCALAFLPCVYERIEVKRNGLVLYQSFFDGEEMYWYDFKSRILHRDLRWVQNFGSFDSFLFHGAGIPVLKRAGEDSWVKFPEGSGADPWQEIPIDTVTVGCVLCMNEIAEDDCLYEYFFLLLYKDGWMPTPAKRSLAEAYADLPSIIDGIKNRRKCKKEEGKQSYTLLCKYKKQNEEWN